MDINKGYLNSISVDFKKVSNYLQKVSCKLREKNYAYPIFLMSKEPAALGIPIISKGASKNIWHYHAIYLDLLVKNSLIVQVEKFKKDYKDPSKYCCLLIVESEHIDFLYIPYT